MTPLYHKLTPFLTEEALFQTEMASFQRKPRREKPQAPC